MLNVGSANVSLKASDDSNFVMGTSYSSLTLLPYGSSVFVSDGNSWYSILGTFDNLKGVFKQTGGSIGGAVTITTGGLSVNNGAVSIQNGAATGVELGSTTVPSTTFLDFHSSGAATDYDVRLAVTNGDTGNAGKGNFSMSCGAGLAKINSQSIVTVKTGTVAPSTAPDFIGQDYLDTTAKKAYKSFGVASSADWVILN